MTLKFEGDLDILKMYLQTKNEAARLRHWKISNSGHDMYSKWKIYENNLTNLQTLLAFTMEHIPT